MEKRCASYYLNNGLNGTKENSEQKYWVLIFTVSVKYTCTSWEGNVVNSTKLWCNQNEQLRRKIGHHFQNGIIDATRSFKYIVFLPHTWLNSLLPTSSRNIVQMLHNIAELFKRISCASFDPMCDYHNLIMSAFEYYISYMKLTSSDLQLAGLQWPIFQKWTDKVSRTEAHI